ncbi:hypothetical protein [Paracoccus aminophilus]|uniref:Uncharacterized protein n=1 Tax=Paracoccus aminophilus JCM 7686 TaxID=1367847 RepID=S5Y8X7_PARAH|nr:hypothetical protein [Paracoccus aminophilus]AGT07803.1 hypothetical protein JCM7686_0694 [Paracoccus aminophilus JCM 7686]
MRIRFPVMSFAAAALMALPFFSHSAETVTGGNSTVAAETGASASQLAAKTLPTKSAPPSAILHKTPVAGTAPAFADSGAAERHRTPIFRPGECPPDMRKSKAPCATATNSGARGFRIGDKVDAANVHVITRPGLYGIGAAPRGSQYGIIDGRLVRYDLESMRIQSVLRYVEAILD